MNLAAMIAAVRTRAGIPSTDALGGDPAITEFINEALAAISTERDWPWLEATRSFVTAANTGTYAAPSDWVRTRSLKVADEAPLRSVSRAQLDYWYPATSDTGRPRLYAVSAEQLVLRPIPDGVYTVTEIYFRSEPELSGVMTPLLPAWAHYAIVEWATSLLLERTRNEDRAERAMRRAQDWLKRLQDDARRTTAPVGVRVRPGGLL